MVDESGWLSTKDILPPFGKCVYVRLRGGDISPDEYYGIGGWKNNYFKNITHWMPKEWLEIERR